MTLQGTVPYVCLIRSYAIFNELWYTEGVKSGTKKDNLQGRKKRMAIKSIRLEILRNTMKILNFYGTTGFNHERTPRTIILSYGRTRKNNLTI